MITTDTLNPSHPGVRSKAAAPVTPKTTTVEWIDFGKDVCEFASDVTQGALAAAVGATAALPAFAAGVRNLPRAASQIWSDALSQPSDDVVDSMLARAAAATAMVPLALTPLAFGLVGLFVGSVGAAMEASENGLLSGVKAAEKVIEVSQTAVNDFDYSL